ncbi:hypothetical protein [Clostridium sp. YIM B02555]|uniref:hypothetical protein n=1 Tax=Clostridium sp. YIM B02555 TaxID=2911968 RepID=UPI001EED755D|nr:hypothetical protein [Clostridium sp. YIM B02555]
MNKEEFLIKIKQENLGRYCIGNFDNICEAPNTRGCALVDGEWLIYETDERGEANVICKCDNEEEAFEKLYNEMVRKKKIDEIRKKLI